LAQVDHVKLDDVKKYWELSVEEAKMKSFYAGNIGKKRALELSQYVYQELKLKQQPAAKALQHSLVLDASNMKHPILNMANPIEGDPNSAVIYVKQLGAGTQGIPTIDERISLALISSIINRPVFDILRTKHQLGYIVFGMTTLHGPTVELRVIVQGVAKGPDDVLSLIDSTLLNITQTFDDMPDEEYENRKEELRKSLKKDAQSVREEAEKWWPEVSQDDSCLLTVNKEKRQLILDNLDSVSKSETKAVYQRLLDSPAKMVVKLYGAKHAQGHSMALVEKVHDPVWFAKETKCQAGGWLGR